MFQTSPRSGNGIDHGPQTDVRTLVRDAQALLTAAAALTGDKADEMRGRGMALLDSALGKAHALQDQAIGRTKELAKASDTYVKDNPWKSIAMAAGVGLLVGVLLGRSK